METITGEADLIARSRTGDLHAFNLLVEHYQQRLYNLCLRMLASPQAAEDATQDAFIAAYRSLPSFRGGSFQSWLFRIAANLCYDELRRRRARPAVSLDAPLEGSGRGLDPPAQVATLDEHVQARELAAALQEALNAIPADQRLAVILCDAQGLDYAEIASIAGVSLGTVKSRIARGRSRLRALLLAKGELLPSHLRQTGEGQ